MALSVSVSKNTIFVSFPQVIFDTCANNLLCLLPV